MKKTVLSTFLFAAPFVVSTGETKHIPVTTLTAVPNLKDGVLLNEPAPAPEGCVWLVNWGVYEHLAHRKDVVMFDAAKKVGTAQGGFLHRLEGIVEFNF